jgi:plasmid stabilization system protein ParE
VSWKLSPAAEADLADALSFYKERASAAVATAFLTDFTRAASLLDSQPGLGTPMAGGRRVFPMRRFPYSLIYRVSGHDVLIAVVAHQHRKPGFWASRT